MGTEIEDLLNKLWQEIEVYLLGLTENSDSLKMDDLNHKIDAVILEAERQLSYTFIEFGHNHKGKGHRVDAVMEQAASKESSVWLGSPSKRARFCPNCIRLYMASWDFR